MGFEDEVEQSIPRPWRQTNGRSKQTCELTSSIVPRGTSFHRTVELEFLLLDWIPDAYIMPTWQRSGCPESSIVADMDTELHNMLTLAEDFLADLIKRKSK